MLVALIAGALAAGCAFAQPYPSKPIRLIVAPTAGGSADLVARAYALRQELDAHIAREMEKYAKITKAAGLNVHRTGARLWVPIQL